ncbi:ABC transporter ATP-binding protein [Microbacterium sp. JZ31]|uniref:ABC transporter ATP-binding protein n=1 Tax=Microbacterium sp. JZ31 TaxID=1906274 RepID=UPI001933D4DE|nr:ABC transporter ATP-binding protein [Microbacterium sp. JZ31]
MTAVIRTEGLVKRYGRVHALAGLDLMVEPGEVHGFLGPNGAGKSTTIRILLGLARATSGRVSVFDADPWREAARLHRRIAYVPGDVSLWPNLSGGEAIDLLGNLRGGRRDRAAYDRERSRLIDVFEFDPRKKGRAYSKGNRQKAALIAAFATPAELYIFDEPTSGLDPLMEQVFNREVRRAASDGATVLLSSHILSEVEQLCTRVSIIRQGALVESGTLAELRHLTRTSVSFSDDGLGSGAERSLAALPGAHDVVREGGRVTLAVDADAMPGALAELVRLRALGVTVAPASLEELFLRHYGDELERVGDHARA